ncbi:MAG TPA: potassium/proton antiporter [Pseudolabrys sp.]|jgi:cell volume regulation protein A|nr:potassium/proton antiporter [Pseudolabrys sp.]
MEALDTVSIAILLGSLLVLAGVLSSLLAMRFGAPLLLVFLLIGVLAGESGPGGLKFNDVGTAYTVGSIALALILFDGGVRTRLSAFRSVLAPAGTLATIGVLVTAVLIAPVAHFALGVSWTEGLLVGSVIASTDAAAVFFLINTRGLRLRSRVNATLEVESGVNDPFAIFMTLALVEILLIGNKTWSGLLLDLLREGVLGGVLGFVGGRLIALVLNRIGLAQGLSAPFVAVGALVIFAFANMAHASGYLAVYLAGLVVGNQKIRAHSSVVVFLDAITWLAQIVMFVLLGLLAWPERLPHSIIGAVIVALTLMLVARPVAVFACLAPFNFEWREKLFIAWVGLRGAVGIFLASIPVLVGLPSAYLYFDVAFMVVLISLLVQGWTLSFAARELGVALRRGDTAPQRIELDLPGQLEQELVGYSVAANSPYLRRRLIPSWAKPTLFIREQRILTPEEAAGVKAGDYVYLLAPPEKAQALDRFFVDMPPPRAPDPRLLGDFFVPGTATLGALADIYGLQIAADHMDITLADQFAEELKRPAKQGDIIHIGSIALLAHKVKEGRVTTVGLQLSEPDEPDDWQHRIKAMVLPRLRKLLGLDRSIR